jgi:hypothetical protein
MKQSITGTVTRVMEGTGNFFIAPDDESALAHLDLDGHRVGAGEISAQLVNATRPKLRPFGADLPEVGDTVTLDLIAEAPDPPRRAAPKRRGGGGDDAETPSE